MNVLDKTFPTPSAFAEWVASRPKNKYGIIEPISGYDQVKLHFGEGNYYMEWDTIFRFNDCDEVSISGVGDSSSLYFKKVMNFTWDDSVIMFEGTVEKPISVKISDIKIRFDAQPAVNNTDQHELSEDNIPERRKIENWIAICQKVNMGIGKEEDKNGNDYK